MAKVKAEGQVQMLFQRKGGEAQDSLDLEGGAESTGTPADPAWVSGLGQDVGKSRLFLPLMNNQCVHTNYN